MRIPSSIAIIFSLCACALAVAWIARSPTAATSPQEVHESSRVLDPRGFIPPADIQRFDQYLTYIRNESNIDIWIVLDHTPEHTTIESTAVDLVERLKIGRDTGSQKGLLLFFDLPSRRLKVEVGYGLETYFPDAYISFLVERHAPMLFSSEDRSRNLRLLLRLIQARIRDAALGGDFDPTPYKEASLGHLSGGAGTSSDLKDTSRANLPTASAQRKFVASSTPNETYAAYLALLTSNSWEPDADLFTQESRQYLRQLSLTRSYRDFILLGEYGKKWRLEIRGDRALLYFTSTPFVSPHFFVKEGDVWRLDLAAEVRNTKERVGGPLTWSYEGADDPYTNAFSDMIAEVQGYRRITLGDNRPIPTANSTAKL